MTADAPIGPKGEIRSPLKGMLLSAVTCGLYAWFWVYKMATEINTFLGYERMNLVKLAGLFIITCNLYWFYFLFVEGKNIIREVQAKAGLPEAPPLIADIIRMQGALNKVWEQVP